MENEKKTRRISKRLSLVLRHRPESIGVALDPEGWVEVSVLLDALGRHGLRLDRSTLDHVVASNDKRRFAFSDDGRRIRASQGHSVDVRLGYEPREPPAVLFHGTVEKFLGLIWAEGLKKGSRHHVHLSADEGTATVVGARRGRPVLLRVDAARMHADGHEFFRSENGVWLTEHVPPEYLG